MRCICSKSVTSRALMAFRPFTQSWRKSIGRPLKSGTSATRNLPCFFQFLISMPPLMMAFSPTMFSPLSSGRKRRGSYNWYVPAAKCMVISCACPSRCISRALRTASANDESGVIWMSAALVFRHPNNEMRRNISFIFICI